MLAINFQRGFYLLKVQGADAVRGRTVWKEEEQQDPLGGRRGYVKTQHEENKKNANTGGSDLFSLSLT